ncbi:MAG: polysaccharide deacetylase family protein [Tunicatimonas sp.]|uniref:polysaccharide deacetylase family protein n=1 Tax=Tunicatimonas sp. TaxID=1940096 RepID=UPI003C762CF7
MLTTTYIALLIVISPLFNLGAQSANDSIDWPDGKQVAISLSFDDARPSQVDTGVPLLDKYNAKATFYLVPSSVERRLSKWKQAATAGHEMGNHSMNHPCTGNFTWSRDKAIEEYSLSQMKQELAQASEQIEALLEVKPTEFAYPCGQTFVGRGINTESYVPVVAELFRTGRGWLDEAPNNPAFCDMAQLMGMPMDGLDFPAVKAIIESAKQHGHWVVFAGHDIGESGRQTTRTAMLKQLLQYAQDPANQVWLAPVGTIAAHIREQRQQ